MRSRWIGSRGVYACWERGGRRGRCSSPSGLDSFCGNTWLIGSAAAAKEGRWSSAKMREGAWHKGGMILVVCIALVADWLIGSILGHIPAVSLPFTYSVLLGPLVIVWYIIGELGSLAEHAVTFGAPVPSWLRNILEIGKNAVDAAGESIAGEGGGDDPKESENTKNE